MTSPRLSAATLASSAAVRSGVTGPLVDPETLTIGIVHFGIGAFHRAHQAVFTEEAAAATGDTSWGIMGVTGRSDSVVRQLGPQDCLYGVLERGVDSTRLVLVGSVRDIAWPGTDSDRVAEVIARPTTHIATLTITEKGYLRAADGDLDVSLDSVRRDVAIIRGELAGESGLAASTTPLGLLVRGLARRFRRGGEPFTVLPCDNLVDNDHPAPRRVVRRRGRCRGRRPGSDARNRRRLRGLARDIRDLSLDHGRPHRSGNERAGSSARRGDARAARRGARRR
jgi:fructuronate reductase